MNMRLDLDFFGTDDRLRESRRYDYPVPVYIQIDELKLGARLHCRDVSRTGVFVESSVLLREGTEVTCTMPIVEGEAFVAKGTIVRTEFDRCRPDRAGMGIEFSVMDMFHLRSLAGLEAVLR